MIPLNRNHPSWPTVQNRILWAPLRMLEADHRHLLVQIRNLRKIFQKWRRWAPEAWSTADKKYVRTWLRNHRLHLGTHFEAEEMTIFPYLTRHAPRLAPVLAKLQHQHHDIRRDSLTVESTFQTICKSAGQGKPYDSFCQKALALLHLIEQHVLHEQRLIESPSLR